MHKSFTLGWITQAIQSLQKELLLVSLSFAVSIVLSAIFSYYVIKTIPSDAKSCEDQDGSKQKFLGQTTANFLPRCDGKHERETKTKYLNPAKDGEFPCKL